MLHIRWSPLFFTWFPLLLNLRSLRDDHLWFRLFYFRFLLLLARFLFLKQSFELFFPLLSSPLTSSFIIFMSFLRLLLVHFDLVHNFSRLEIVDLSAASLYRLQ